MERIAFDIHRIVQELYDFPGGLNDDSKFLSEYGNEYRRTLRRLDRCLKQIEQQQQQQSVTADNTPSIDEGRNSNSSKHTIKNDNKHYGPNKDTPKKPTISEILAQDSVTEQDESGTNGAPDNPNAEFSAQKIQPHSDGMFFDQFQQDILVLLTRLGIPSQEETASLATSIINQLSWMCVDFCLVMSVEDIMVVLSRLLNFRNQLEHSHSSDDSIYCKLCSAWLTVANAQLIKIEELCEWQQLQEDTNEHLADSTLRASASIFEVPITLLVEFLQYSLDTVQVTQWEPKAVGSEYTETHVQWRILTGYLLDQWMRSYRQSSNNKNGFEWLCDRWYDASVPVEAVPTAANDFLHLLTTYVTALTDYALDSLDGAAVVFTSASKMVGTADSVGGDDKFAAETAVQDSLRHCTLAVNLLESIYCWTELRSVRWKQLISLWNTMASSFMARSYYITALQESDQGDRLCHDILHLADIVLGSVEADLDSVLKHGSKTLTLTFLRAMDYPDQLMSADNLWKVIEKRLAVDRQLKHVLQSAVLTLCRQFMLPAEKEFSTEQQQGAQAIVDRLLPLLNYMPSTNAKSGESRSTSDPWDSFFSRQLGGVSNTTNEPSKY